MLSHCILLWFADLIEGAMVHQHVALLVWLASTGRRMGYDYLLPAARRVVLVASVVHMHGCEKEGLPGDDGSSWSNYRVANAMLGREPSTERDSDTAQP